MAVTEDKSPPQTRLPRLDPGVFFAHTADLAQAAVFSSEKEALRWAVEVGAKVRRVPYGVELRDHLGLTPKTAAVGGLPTDAHAEN